MAAYYNENDPAAAQWLRNLIAAGHIAPGDVDDRSIVDVCPDDLRGYAQCHFFAGIGIWSYALRLARWSDDRPVWTGSCPCQPFSPAGKGDGFDDERHLWPHWHHLIRECRPSVVLGEQVAGKDGLGWLDLVSSDLAGEDYALGAFDLCAPGIGAPHIRQRLFFGAYDTRLGLRGLVNGFGPGLEGHARDGAGRDEPGRLRSDEGGSVAPAGRADRMEYADGRDACAERQQPCGQHGLVSEDRGAGGLADDFGPDLRGEPGGGAGAPRADEDEGVQREWGGSDHCGRRADDPLAGSERGLAASGRDAEHRPGPTNGHWRDADWLHCRDGKWRPVEPGTQPLAHGVAARVVRLRAYGNGIVAPLAQAFIEEFSAALEDIADVGADAGVDPEIEEMLS